MMSDEQTKVEPWYRQFWPWYLIGLLLQCSLSAGAGLLLYGLVANWAAVPEATQISHQLSGQIRRRFPFGR